jgi:hypothetical protein
MNQISKDPRTNRALLWLGGLLALLWAITIATWMYDDAGNTVGMPMPVFLLHLAAPLLVGIIVGWRRVGLWPGTKAGMIAGALFGAANIAVQLLWGGALYLMGRIPPNQPFTFLESVFEVFEFLVLFTLVGLILGAIGGFFGAAFAARARGE